MTLDIDAAAHNHDWLKGRTWDLWTADGSKIVSTLDELRDLFRQDDDRLAHFLELPSARPMPKKLRAEVDAYLHRGVVVKMRVYKSDEIERLAALEHEQWMSWTRALVKRGGLDPETVKRWQALWVPYEKLAEDEKEKDREWARKALAVIEKSDDETGAAWAAKRRIEDEFEKAEWDESKHPRIESGKGGGEFTSGSGGSGSGSSNASVGGAKADAESGGRAFGHTAAERKILRDIGHRPLKPEERAILDAGVVPGGEYKLIAPMKPPIVFPQDAADPMPENPHARAAAKVMLERIGPIGAKAQADIQAIAKDYDGAMYGLEHQFKSEDSLTRKLAGYMEGKGYTAEDAQKYVGDALRYTVVFKDEHYVDSVARTMAKMSDAGYKVNDHRGRNYWTDRGLPSDYKGVNIVYNTPDGQLMELQFHTPESIHVKELLSHPIYEQVRIGRNEEGKRLTAEEKRALATEARRLWDAINVPGGAAHIPDLISMATATI